MDSIGKEVICDRCHERIFLRKVASEELDGGFTQYDVFEDRPKEWKVGYNAKGARRDLCPACYNKYEELLNTFWVDVDGPSNYISVKKNNISCF